LVKLMSPRRRFKASSEGLLEFGGDPGGGVGLHDDAPSGGGGDFTEEFGEVPVFDVNGDGVFVGGPKEGVGGARRGRGTRGQENGSEYRTLIVDISEGKVAEKGRMQMQNAKWISALAAQGPSWRFTGPLGGFIF